MMTRDHESAADAANRTVDAAEKARETLVAAAQLFRLIEERTSRATGLTAVEARTLRAVDLVGLTRGITAVGWVTGVQQPAATASVRRLEDSKLVRRSKKTGSRGRAALTLTQEGRRKLDALAAFEAAAFGVVLKRLPTVADRKAFIALLDACAQGKLGPIEQALVTVVVPPSG